jgi:ADP-ribose pyrophosphatase YjhB (NUDIX family)
MAGQIMPLTESDNDNDNNKNNNKKMTIKNNIVTAFIEYQGKVLLLRRSQKVKSMKGKWAGVSGYIETQQEPLRQAFKEVREETGLIMLHGLYIHFIFVVTQMQLAWIGSTTSTNG